MRICFFQWTKHIDGYSKHVVSVETGVILALQLNINLQEFGYLVYVIGRHKKLNVSRKDLIKQLNDKIFTGCGDFQKKKPGLAIYFRKTQTLILIKAKFEEGFDKLQT